MKAFNPSLKAAQRIMGEEFEHAGLTYMAINIDDLTSSVTVVPGGKLANVTLTVLISAEVAALSRIKENDTIKARGKEFHILSTSGDGGDSLTLNCGPVGVSLPRF